MHTKNRALLVAIACLGLAMWSAPHLWATDETRQDILDQNSADKIETQQDTTNAAHPDVPPPSFDDVLKRAEKGEAQAQHMLGRRYYFGDGVIQDREKAAAWQTRAANQGHATAQYVLGLLYGAGEGVHRDTGKEVAWITRSANQGLAEAQYALGMMYQAGEDVPQDSHKAAELFLRAAAQGHERAKGQLSGSAAQGRP